MIVAHTVICGLAIAWGIVNSVALGAADAFSSTQPAPVERHRAAANAPDSPHESSSLFWPKDDVALRQEADTFTTLEDGQPAGPGDWELQMQSGWSTGSDASHHDPVLLAPAVKYTPHRYGPTGAAFLENMQLRLRTPFELGTGYITGNGDLDFGWQQRWLREAGLVPTFSTLGEVRMPTRNGSSGADGTLTGIAAKSAGPGTAYLNAWVRSANGNDHENVRPFQWGFRGGYKLPLSDRLALLAVYSHASSQQEGHANRNMLELGAMFRTKHHLSFGPGVFVGLDDHAESPDFGAGFRFIYLFNARDNPTAEKLGALRAERAGI